MDIREINKLYKMLNSGDGEIRRLGKALAEGKLKEELANPVADSVTKTLINFYFRVDDERTPNMLLGILARMGYEEGLKQGNIWKSQQRSSKC